MGPGRSRRLLNCRLKRILISRSLARFAGRLVGKRRFIAKLLSLLKRKDERWKVRRIIGRSITPFVRFTVEIAAGIDRHRAKRALSVLGVDRVGPDTHSNSRGERPDLFLRVPFWFFCGILSGL